MDFHRIWQEQCEATRAIRECVGVEDALDYLVGEKLVNFAKAAELRGYVATLKPAARKKLQKLLYVSS